MSTKEILLTLNELQTEYDKMFETKRELLNQTKMIQYLFYKPIHKYDDLSKAFESCTNYYAQKVKMSEADASRIETLFYYLHVSTEKYKIYYEKYTKLPRISTNLEKIGKGLEHLEVTDYITHWSFCMEEDHVNGKQRIPYNFDMNFVVDIYGLILINKCTMVNFAIIYDSANKKITIKDYLIQYYLCQMNVPLLRINTGCKVISTLKKFINEIKKSDKYVSMNVLNIKNLKGHETSIKKMLNIFYKNYQYNHKLFLKYYVPDEDNEIDGDAKIYNYTRNPEIESYETTEENVIHVIKKKEPKYKTENVDTWLRTVDNVDKWLKTIDDNDLEGMDANEDVDKWLKKIDR